MKKVLSVFLATLMLFACLSVGASAEEVTPGVGIETQWHGDGKPANYDQVVVEFDLMGGTLKYPALVYDKTTGQFVPQENVKDLYTMVPQSPEVMKEGYDIILPAVTAPKNQQFDGWFCAVGPASVIRNTYGANAAFTLPAGSANTIMHFVAQYSPTAVEEDTMAKVMSILFKVFGTILGILLYGGDSEAGVAVMEKIFGNIF